MFHFDHGYVTFSYVSFYLVGNGCAQIVAIFLVYVSSLAWCSALCIFEKHMLAFVALIHSLPKRGRKVPIHVSMWWGVRVLALNLLFPRLFAPGR
jgi:hypothetical protein